ncbi:MAG: penicillin-binding protein activator LpoB [Desulfuromonadales bacterium C00003094]|nr:MAG: penicillin-binding protein activator LpoB [Desulfuromonadales bacterium C00003094]
MRRRVAWLLPMTVLLLLVGCSTKVERMEIGEVKDLSGRWNDSDSQMVSEAMVQDCLNHPWLSDYSIRSGKKPDLIVGSIRNRSSEHIATEVFVKDLERALVNSGRANFVASSEERSDVRSERLDQDLNAAPETRNAPGMEAGADFILIGSINSIMDQEKGEKVIFYQVDLELVDMRNNRKVWLGTKKIKKSVSRNSFGF